MTAIDDIAGGPRRKRRSGLDLPAIRTMDWVAAERVRKHYPLLLEAATRGDPSTRLYAVGLLRTLPAKDLRPLISDIESAAALEARSLTGRLLADLAQVIAAA